MIKAKVPGSDVVKETTVDLRLEPSELRATR